MKARSQNPTDEGSRGSCGAWAGCGYVRLTRGERGKRGGPLIQSLRLLSLAAHRGAEIAEWAVEDKVEIRVLREIGKAETGKGLEVNRELDNPR